MLLATKRYIFMLSEKIFSLEGTSGHGPYDSFLSSQMMGYGRDLFLQSLSELKSFVVEVLEQQVFHHIMSPDYCGSNFTPMNAIIRTAEV